MTRRPVAWVLAAALLASSAACSTSAQDLPLPGSRVSGDSFTVTAEFGDALNLADGAAVKQDGVPIGRVRSIRVKDFRALVRLDIEKAHPLPVGSTARLRSTTPLGELFVQIDSPAHETRTLRDGAVLGPDATSVAPTIEDTMSAASMLVNGGGLGQIETIVEEANAALGGREGTARDTLRRLAATARELNRSDDDISAALDALARVSTVLHQRQDVVVAALRDVRPAARVLRENTAGLTDLLSGVDRLGDTVVDVIEQSGGDLESMLAEMGPIFEQLNTVESSFTAGLRTVIGFADLIDRAVPGDFLNTYLYFQTQASLGVPHLPLVGDTGLPRLDTPKLDPGASPTVEPSPSPSVAPSGTPDLGLSGLLGGGR